MLETIKQLFIENWDSLLVLILGGGLVGAGFLKIIQKLSGKGAIVFRELSQAFGSGADMLEALNKDIKDDGKLDAAEIKDLLKNGKTVVKEFKDVKLIIQPKKEVTKP